jgi:hypothetical protein
MCWVLGKIWIIDDKIIQYSDLGSILKIVVVYARGNLTVKTFKEDLRTSKKEEEEVYHSQTYFQCCPKQSSRTQALLLEFD